MLTLYPVAPQGKGDGDPGAAVWIDLVSPTPEETARVEATLGAPLPTLGALSEIESSSRLRKRDGVLYMSTPSAARRDHGEPAVNPLGFVLSAERLITICFMPMPALEAMAARFADAADPDDVPTSAREVFAELCEAIVDKIADGLEHLAEEVRAISVAAFHNDDAKGRHPVRANRLLRLQLRQVGRLGDRLSEVRDGLLGLGRIAGYVEQFGCDDDEAFKGRLASLRQDIHSLSDYEEQLAGKIQFTLDALVGLIGIAQNDVFKVLTIVSIVGVPPTLMAGVYGMNFKNIPEYDWTFGYQWGWGVIIVSGLIPLIWFKIKGWF